ncbi:uncharacterized protein, partial [Triticum aestivum]|uniref:uncharacterized protein n=1 Tax=Triticum aestivum TaxID=4565 RepID=UPI001D01FCEE
ATSAAAHHKRRCGQTPPPATPQQASSQDPAIGLLVRTHLPLRSHALPRRPPAPTCRCPHLPPPTASATTPTSPSHPPRCSLPASPTPSSAAPYDCRLSGCSLPTTTERPGKYFIAVRALKKWQVERFVLRLRGCWLPQYGARASLACGFHQLLRSRTATAAVHRFGVIPAIINWLQLVRKLTASTLVLRLVFPGCTSSMAKMGRAAAASILLLVMRSSEERKLSWKVQRPPC